MRVRHDSGLANEGAELLCLSLGTEGCNIIISLFNFIAQRQFYLFFLYISILRSVSFELHLDFPLYCGNPVLHCQLIAGSRTDRQNVITTHS